MITDSFLVPRTVHGPNLGPYGPTRPCRVDGCQEVWRYHAVHGWHSEGEERGDDDR